ncbi:site-specific integrase [Azonexus hydrophilus]
MAAIVQRGEKWQAKVRRDGYPGVSKTFARKSDAEAWARAQEAEMDRGAWRDRSSADSTTLYKLLERYLADVVPTKRGAAVETLRIKTLMSDKLTLHKLSALSPLVLSEWIEQRAKVVSGSTINRELNVISACVNWGRKRLMIQTDNPVAGIIRPPQGKARERRLEDGEEARLLEALEVSPREGGKFSGMQNKWVNPIVLFALETAMRRSELLSLEWKNVDLKKRVAYLETTKNGESRAVPLSSRAVAVLEGLKEGKDGVQALPVGKVFRTTEAALKKAFERACERAGIDDFHFHDLRHEATSRLAERLPNLIELAAVTGHKDLRMLKRYYPPRAEDLARKLG